MPPKVTLSDEASEFSLRVHIPTAPARVCRQGQPWLGLLLPLEEAVRPLCHRSSSRRTQLGMITRSPAPPEHGCIPFNAQRTGCILISPSMAGGQRRPQRDRLLFRLVDYRWPRFDPCSSGICNKVIGWSRAGKPGRPARAVHPMHSCIDCTPQQPHTPFRCVAVTTSHNYRDRATHC